MTTQDTLWAGAGVAVALAVLAGVADWRRARRTVLDDPGWVPWRGIQVLALFGTLLFALLAARA